jgi:hypothetical protein
MAKIFRETLGHELLLESLEGIDEGQLPSPEDLKYKILLKVCNISTLTNDRSKILRRKAKTRFRIRAQTRENLEPNQIPSLQQMASARLCAEDIRLANLRRENHRKSHPFCLTWQSTQKRTSSAILKTPNQLCITMYSVFRNQRSRNFSKTHIQIIKLRSIIYDI